jgi:3',5'-cyclic-AMP phosphodiesterase
MKQQFLILFLPLLISCGMEYTPWSSKTKYTNINDTSIAKLGNPEKAPFKIALVGDPQMGPGGFHRVIKKINQRNDIDFIAILGDITDAGLISEWDWVGEGINNSKLPVIGVVGNHDGLSNGKDAYKRMFGKLNNSFDYKGVHFVIWNNNKLEWGTPNFKFLQNNSFSNTFVMSHQPPGSGTLNKSDEDKWDKARIGTLGSAHGHLHHFGLKVRENVPVYTVAKIVKEEYGIVSFGDKTRFYNCDGACSEVDYDN